MSSSFKPDKAQAWLVLKFGGTSVSSAANWHNIAHVLRLRIAEHFRPVVVHSALSGVTDRLESLLTAALTAVHTPVLDHIEAAHRDLAGRLGVVPNPQFEAFMRELRDMAAQLAERRRIDDATRARVMAMGELLSTTLGAEFLNAQGIATAWVDVRQVLRADDRDHATHQSSLLSATCDFTPGLEAAGRLALARSRGAHPRFHRGQCRR